MGLQLSAKIFIFPDDTNTNLKRNVLHLSINTWITFLNKNLTGRKNVQFVTNFIFLLNVTIIINIVLIFVKNNKYY